MPVRPVPAPGPQRETKTGELTDWSRRDLGNSCGKSLIMETTVNMRLNFWNRCISYAMCQHDCCITTLQHRWSVSENSSLQMWRVHQATVVALNRQLHVIATIILLHLIKVHAILKCIVKFVVLQECSINTKRLNWKVSLHVYIFHSYQLPYQSNETFNQGRFRKSK